MYDEWGFSRNPFDTSPLQADELGSRLLLGRESALRKIKARIRVGTKAATIEGLNGIGKTSVANVAAFQLYKQTFEKNTEALYLPCRTVFQLSENVDAHELRRQVLREVVQTLLQYVNDLPIPSGFTRPHKSKALDTWLNSTNSKNFQIGFSGATLGYGQAEGGSTGFDRSGFEKAAVDWLRLVFPSIGDGGVICVIDNMELLRSSRKASKVIEELRDPLLTIPGVRWILCGTAGIFHGAGESERLAGFLHNPLSLGDVSDAFLDRVFEERVLNARHSDRSFLPISKRNFFDVYHLFRGNLRHALSTLDDFCCYVYDEGIESKKELRATEFDDWLSALALAKHDAVLGEIGQNQLDIFYEMCIRKEITRYVHFDFAIVKESDFLSKISKLVMSGVLVLVENDSDHSRDYYRVSSKGRLVASHLDRLNRFRDFRSFESNLPPEDEWFKTSPQWSGETQID